MIGSGGREHALVHHLCNSPRVDSVIVIPGNGGTYCSQISGKTVKNVSIDMSESGLVEYAQAEKVGLVIVGPELPLVMGVVDAMTAKVRLNLYNLLQKFRLNFFNIGYSMFRTDG